MIRTIQISAITLSLLVVACTEQGVEPSTERTADTPAPTQVEAPGVTAESVQDARPEFYDQVLRLEPQVTRNGFLRLTDPVINDPDAAPILLLRIESTAQDTMLRAALVEALPRTGGDYASQLVALIPTEKDDVVRSVMVRSLRTADAEAAIVGLKLGLEDSATDVRAEAARTLARRQDGAALSAELIAALGDDDLAVRVEASRALGALSVTEAIPALSGALEHDEADVRLNALRAISRIDAQAARTLPGLDRLTGDPDPRIVRVASEIAATR